MLLRLVHQLHPAADQLILFQENILAADSMDFERGRVDILIRPAQEDNILLLEYGGFDKKEATPASNPFRI